MALVGWLWVQGVQNSCWDGAEENEEERLVKLMVVQLNTMSMYLYHLGITLYGRIEDLLHVARLIAARACGCCQDQPDLRSK